jgi:hypothetical protein
MKKLYLLTLTILLCTFPIVTKVYGHYSLTGDKLLNSGNHKYQYYTPSSGGKAIPSDWRPSIGLAASDWNAQSSKIYLNVSTDTSTKTKFYVSDYVDDIADCITFGNDPETADYFFIRFNSSEEFYTDGRDYDVKTVALHELGHGLGLHHVGDIFSLSDTRAHMMYYTYSSPKGLHAHDIEGLISIYGY